MKPQQSTIDQTINSAEISTREIVKHLKLSLQMPSVLTGLINQKIIKQTAEKEGVRVREEELQLAADRFRFENGLIGSQDTLRWLEKHYLSVTEFEDLIQNNVLTQKLGEHLFKDKVEPYFYAHQLDYNQASIYEIVLADFDLAMELFYGIQEQELSFWELAHQYIEDDGLRRRGGYIGMKTRDRFHPEIATAVFSLDNDDLPQVLKPIPVEKKTHLIYVEEIIPPVLNDSLSQKITSQLYEQWLIKQHKELSKQKNA